MLAAPEPEMTVVIEAPDVRLRQVLEGLAKEVSGLRALVVGDRSGLPIASVGRGPKTLAATAMATLALSAAEKVTSALGLPAPRGIVIEADPWVVLVQSLGNGFTLLSVFPTTKDLEATRDAIIEGAVVVRELLDEMR